MKFTTEDSQLFNQDFETFLFNTYHQFPENVQREISDTIAYVIAGDHGQSFDKMKKWLNTEGRNSIYGGRAAELKLKLIKEKISGYLMDEKELLKIALCENFKYCEKRKNGDFQNEDFTLGLSVSDALVTYEFSFPLPIITLAAYMVRTRFLDGFCACG